jgi:hypothetical protein
VLADSRTAIVEVYGLIPPGARAGQRVDVLAQAVMGSQTRSLDRGHLYTTALRIGGADPLRPNATLNIYMRAAGSVFVNPGYSVGSASTQPSGVASLRNGLVLGGGVVAEDRPIWMRARNPQLRTTRTIEYRIDQRFGDERVATTQDEGIVNVFVPVSFSGDWEHFIKICSHLYIDGSPEVGVAKARMLAAEAVKKDAALMDISLCWEGIGESALPFIQPLYAHENADVAYAAARAGAYMGDAAAAQSLSQMGKTEGHPFQVNAAKTLADLPASPRNDRIMSELVSTRNALVRIAAYQSLVRHDSPLIYSRTIRGSMVLDRVPSSGPPLVYCSRSGQARIAIFGEDLSLNTPVFFAAMNDKFTIATAREGRGVVLFDRTNDAVVGGVQARSQPLLHEILLRLAGGTDDGFSLSYSDLVGIVQALTEARHLPSAFVLQDPPALQDAIEDAPPLEEPGPVTAENIGPGLPSSGNGRQ